eukprot:5145254-Pyramimonas_sp.AAC.1
MLWLSLSATITLPPPSTATPLGVANCAAVPSPSRKPRPPVPANVDTMPCVEILRMRRLPKSPTMTLPSPSTATPVGVLN